ncbi:MAG TPA: class I SAM-dependent methyltransferase [Natronosporangium sp.]
MTFPDESPATAPIWDERDAAHYDQGSAEMFAPEVLESTVDFLAGLAPGGRALELAIGTGRVALPLSARGVTVAGIDNSAAMVAVLRGKPGGDRIEVVIGDMADATVNGTFDLVYLVFNTIGNLLTQDAQVACFRNAARHLRPGGRFVIEMFVPDLRRLPVGALGQLFR